MHGQDTAAPALPLSFSLHSVGAGSQAHAGGKPPSRPEVVLPSRGSRVLTPFPRGPQVSFGSAACVPGKAACTEF